ncbi:Protein arginine methyltransferase NDUFAF7-like mitochondrial protein [Lachnellula suecica]|uniref:Protein arginine methyltransferase NDUFAF7 n=1 Tax=Lachnellula suecica TaxID=602035 RepID=A0A8T9CN86_9HELO|nr:Protein arginine methyltransferase NDUFAF7-like mitochondrial protein [Lachnellula suecica]
MDSPIVSRLFRQLFTHRSCQALRSHSSLPFRTQHARRHAQTRCLSSGRGDGEGVEETKWQQRMDMWPLNKEDEYNKFPMVTADQLRSRRERPRRVKMLTRDFIEDSLYNPSYGYFSKQAVIFTPGEPFDFNKLQDEPEFHKLLGQRYTELEDKLDAKRPNDSRQLWHTPTELFRPYYGEAIARYLIENYKLSQYPYHDLIIYEMGAGNGTLMLNILDYIRDTEPSVYDRTKFKIIEISSHLAQLQTNHLMRNANSKGHHSKVEIINKSIFEWDQVIPSPCYFLAMEVFDNFAHDAIRYDFITEEPLQGTVLIDTKGDFYEFYVPHIDPVASRFLRVRHAATGGRYPHPLSSSRLLRKVKSVMPFAANLSQPEYIPTRLMQFFDVLGKYFPAHRLLTSDFHDLPDAIKGINSPVVQTRYKRRTVPVTTPFVHQGYFDILFPTDFNVIELMYRAITGKLTRVLSHEEFLRKWAYVEETETKSGENPLLTWYKNASVLTTV